MVKVQMHEPDAITRLLYSEQPDLELVFVHLLNRAYSDIDVSAEPIVEMTIAKGPRDRTHWPVLVTARLPVKRAYAYGDNHKYVWELGWRRLCPTHSSAIIMMSAQINIMKQNGFTYAYAWQPS